MCKCKEKKAKGLREALSLLMESAMAAEPIEYVSLGLNEKAVLGSKIFIPARIESKLRREKVPFLKGRLLTIVSQAQSVPVAIRDWMSADYRYKGWFGAVPAPDEMPVPVAAELEMLGEEDEDATIGGEPVEVTEVVTTPVLPELPEPEEDSIFDLWEREDIEDANLTGEEGLMAYAAYHHIDLGEATLKAEVLEAILEWFDANNF